MKKFRKYIPIVKIDKEEQMVYGWASTEDVDSDGEIIKASALEKALPDYMKFPTLREMHQPIAVGKTTQAKVKKEGKQKGLYIGAKIVAKDAWEKVKEEVYPAFSIGGNVIKKVGNVIHELELVEISLVDVPANKAAVVEIWKKDKLDKNAETAYSMANLVIHVKDTISYYEYLGKDTKKLKKALEVLKQVLAQEAAEPEDDGNKSAGLFEAKNAAELIEKISHLEALDFSKNPNADLIRKGVIESMKKKVKDIEKQDDTQDDADEKDQDTDTDADTGAGNEGSDADTDNDTDADTGSDEGEKGDLAQTLTKLEELSEKVEKLQPSKKDEQEATDLVKAVSSMAGSLEKVANYVASLEERIAKLENTPAAPKSKSTVVHKTSQTDETKNKDSKNAPLIEKKRARLIELNDIFDDIGAHEFAKRGHSKEAVRLQEEIAKLEAE